MLYSICIAGDKMDIDLGAPYEAFVQRIIEKEYAENPTEVLRQALVVYERQIEEEEMRLVHKAVEVEMEEIRSGKVKTIPWEEVKKELGSDGI
jgi:Arc/MetJ-type ribon-helix-helix transcriptional regulator